MPKLHTIFRNTLAMLLALVFIGGTFLASDVQAQPPVSVNKNGKMTRSAKVKDANGRSFRLKKGHKVKVIYKRGAWFWVKNRAGREAWVKKKFVRVLAAKKSAKQKAKAKDQDQAKAKQKRQAEPAKQSVETQAETDREQAPKVIVAKSDPAAVQRNSASTEALEAQQTDKVKIAVLELKSTDMSDKLTGFLTNVVTDTLDSLGPFRALSTTDIARVLEYEATNQQLGCDEPSCMTKLGNSLGARWLVSGDISKVGQSYIVQLKLFDPRDGQVKKRVTREHQGAPEALFKDLRVASKMLVRDLLKARAGTLQLDASEEGATVLIDEVCVGVTPVKDLQVSGGMHSLQLQKEGFIDFKQDFEIYKGQPFGLKARMQPSDDYRRQYRKTAHILRSVAIVSLGTAVLAGLTGGFFYYDGVQRASALEQDVVDYNAQEVRTSAQRETIMQQREDLAAVDIVVLTAAGFALATGLLGTGFYLFGGDPDRYE